MCFFLKYENKYDKIYYVITLFIIFIGVVAGRWKNEVAGKNKNST